MSIQHLVARASRRPDEIVGRQSLDENESHRTVQQRLLMRDGKRAKKSVQEGRSGGILLSLVGLVTERWSSLKRQRRLPAEQELPLVGRIGGYHIFRYHMSGAYAAYAASDPPEDVRMIFVTWLETVPILCSTSELCRRKASKMLD